MSEKKLRPCPFCGETPHVYEIPAHKHGRVMILHVDAQTAHRLIDGTQTAITFPVTWENSLVDDTHRVGCRIHWRGFCEWTQVESSHCWKAVFRDDKAFYYYVDPIPRPGDEILFKEPWCGGQYGTAIQYKAEWRDGEYGPQWRSPYHMPREAIRLKRTLVSVRGVWPKELTEEEIEDEGLERGTYCDCPTDPPGYGHRPLCECSDSSLKQAFHDYYIAKHCGMWDHPAWRYEVKG